MQDFAMLNEIVAESYEDISIWRNSFNIPSNYPLIFYVFIVLIKLFTIKCAEKNSAKWFYTEILVANGVEWWILIHFNIYKKKTWTFN